MSTFQHTHPLFNCPDRCKQLLLQSRPVLLCWCESMGNISNWQLISTFTVLEQLCSTSDLGCITPEIRCPRPAFLEASTPSPSHNPSLNPSLNLSLSLSSIQFILFDFLKSRSKSKFFKSRSKSKSLWGVFAYAYVMLCWSNTDSATAHGEA